MPERLRQNLDSDLAVELRIRCSPDFTHPAFAKLGGDAVVRDGVLGSHRSDFRNRITSRSVPGAILYPEVIPPVCRSMDVRWGSLPLASIRPADSLQGEANAV